MNETNQSGMVADAPKSNWVDRFAPEWLKPYARLARWDRPIGWWLLFLPCLWSATLAADAKGFYLPNLWHIALFWIGSVAMRGAGCTYNDLVDRDIDAAVARTASRPIPSGQVSVAGAKVFLVLQALAGLLVLLQFNIFTIWLGIASLGFVAAYPFMKRITDWPQLVLGLAFSWGALVGWAALFGSLSLAPVCLYLGGILWTIGYDTIYAHQDKEDDAVVGVRSTALLFGAATRYWLIAFYGGATLLFGLGFILADAGLFAFGGLVAGLAHLAWQAIRLDIDNADDCLRLFKSNRDYGLILFAGLLADALITAG
ncbi:4-hydroxybenzoate octaprenyltransferase [Coralliovum pocilloporae]|uniref:4-hydroxybenzoate octaprenyltransferase n=1 Tax=Coralliovum pocilloporae TaxID=3066369 RepID=UPI0033074650